MRLPIPPGWIFAIMGAFTGGAGVRNAWLGIRSRQWSSVSGTIKTSSVKWARRTVYVPQITYTYQVGPKEFSGTRRFFGDGWATSVRYLAQRAVDKYAPGTTVIVYIDPANPARSTLETGFFMQSLGQVLFGAAFLGLGFAALTGVFPLNWK